jgi:hypothetical protein
MSAIDPVKVNQTYLKIVEKKPTMLVNFSSMLGRDDLTREDSDDGITY